MLNISGLQEGVVLDHIQAGKSLDIYYHLGLDRLTDCQVAIIKNARSNKMGRKDIIKVEGPIDTIDLDARTRAASPPLSRSCLTSSILQMRRLRLTAACTA